MRLVLTLLIMLGAGIVGWLVWQQRRSSPLVVSGFIEADEVRVGSRVGGRVAEVWAGEGQTVRIGTPLFRLDPFDLRERLAQAQAQLVAYRAEYDRVKAGYRTEEIEQAAARRDRVSAQLDELMAGPRKQEIEIARQQVNVARADLELAQSEYDRLVRLRTGEQAAKLEFEQAERALKASQARWASAEQELDLLLEGARKEDIAQARAALEEAEHALKGMKAGFRVEEIAQAAARVAEAEAESAAIQVQLNELNVSSPCDCTVEAVDLQSGDLVAANAPAVSLLDTSKLWVRSYVPESRLGEVPLGMQVPIRVSSAPAARAMGRVTFIAREAEFTPRNIQTPEERSKQVFRVKVTLEGGVEGLHVGMSADVLFGEVARP